MTTTEAVADVLAAMREWGNGEGGFNDNPDPDGKPFPLVYYSKQGWDQLCDRIEAAIAASAEPVAFVRPSDLRVRFVRNRRRLLNSIERPK
jgi:hypothetical protein